MVRSHIPQIRMLCEHSLVIFLLEYPMGEKLLKEYMSGFMGNISYEYADGRVREIIGEREREREREREIGRDRKREDTHWSYSF